MHLTYRQLRETAERYGDAFYLLYADRFIANYRELLAAFRTEYPNTEIAYSYKTNYIPALCRAVNDLGGYAEVVSHMEFALARRIGVPYEKIVFNGPYKQPVAVKELLLGGGCAHLDSLSELGLLRSIAEERPEATLNVGVRVNFPIEGTPYSRFGFDAEGDELQEALRGIQSLPNVRLQAVHCHFAPRSLETWPQRALGVMKLIRGYGLRPERIDLGGGMFGKMDERLKRQFGGLPAYSDYATAVGEVLREWLDADYRPMLMIEPGSALTGDCMDLAAKVQSVKTVQGHKIATVLASTHNISMGSKIPPVDVFSPNAYDPEAEDVFLIGGYTCIESDILVREYQGTLHEGDFAVFRNVGSYSVVLKPPFIMPNVPILSLDRQGYAEVVKRGETAEDVFRTYFHSEGERA